MSRAHNFSAGPAALPFEVLEKVKEEFLDYGGAGSSIIELSHRGSEYVEVDRLARERLVSLLGLGDDFEVLFLQGGASHQFMMVPFNFLSEGETADYINTGTWSKKAIKEAKLFGNVHTAFSSEESNFSRVPTNADLKFSANAKYVHFTSNNTIFGTQFPSEPETNGVPLVCDASSDFLSRPLDVDKYGLIYAGAQKNAGPAGLTIVIVRKDFLAKSKKEGIPTILNYHTHVGTMFNTPPVFGVYVFEKVLGWIQGNGGLAEVEKVNKAKATLLYSEIDQDDFYTGTTEVESRSLMNVTFRLGSEELEKQFVSQATAHNLKGLKGHRSVGGIRASIYNACSIESVKALAEFMKEFRAKNG
ncbi:MAG: 3-phosphoserine/phosphohydroxythreonine transaminase [Balneolales bacterium]|nr:3-phosphoserine/phosphohydroxythreonine transaminase [Balneolales bacterium]